MIQSHLHHLIGKRAKIKNKVNLILVHYNHAVRMALYDCGEL